MAQRVKLVDFIMIYKRIDVLDTTSLVGVKLFTQKRKEPRRRILDLEAVALTEKS